MKTSDQYTAAEWKALPLSEKQAIKIYEATGKELGQDAPQGTLLKKSNVFETTLSLMARQQHFDQTGEILAGPGLPHQFQPKKEVIQKEETIEDKLAKRGFARKPVNLESMLKELLKQQAQTNAPAEVAPSPLE